MRAPRFRAEESTAARDSTRSACSAPSGWTSAACEVGGGTLSCAGRLVGSIAGFEPCVGTRQAGRFIVAPGQGLDRIAGWPDGARDIIAWRGFGPSPDSVADRRAAATHVVGVDASGHARSGVPIATGADDAMLLARPDGLSTADLPGNSLVFARSGRAGAAAPPPCRRRLTRSRTAATVHGPVEEPQPC